MICRKCRKELVDGDQVTKITFESGELEDGDLPIANIDNEYFVCDDCIFGLSI